MLPEPQSTDPLRRCQVCALPRARPLASPLMRIHSPRLVAIATCRTGWQGHRPRLTARAAYRAVHGLYWAKAAANGPREGRCERCSAGVRSPCRSGRAIGGLHWGVPTPAGSPSAQQGPSAPSSPRPTRLQPLPPIPTLGQQRIRTNSHPALIEDGPARRAQSPRELGWAGQAHSRRRFECVKVGPEQPADGQGRG